MNKSSVTRDHFKHNFLKNIIVRFDFRGVTDVELDGIIYHIKTTLKDAGYNSFEEEYNTELDFQVQDPETIEIEGLQATDVRRQKAYVFFNEQKGIRLKVSSKFVFVTLQQSKYIPYTEYCDSLVKVVNLFKTQVEFFQCVRFGFRKVNQCILFDLKQLNEYFETSYYPILNAEGDNKLFEVKDCFNLEKYSVNLVRMVVNGQYQGKWVYQITLDADLYTKDRSYIDYLLDENNEISAMNDILFEIYKKSITENFIQKLGNTVFEDSGIIEGVESNE